MGKKKNKEPRLYEIVIAAVLSGILGVVGAVAYLALQAPEEVDELPAAEDRELGRLYYVVGAKGDESHATWEAKVEALKSGRSGTFSVVEQELNQWAAARLGSKAGEKGADGAEGEEGEAPADDGEKPFLHVEPGTPNFHIAENRLFIGAPLEWNFFGMTRSFDALTSGQFEERDGVFAYKHDRVYVGSCPLPGFVADRLVRDVVASYNVPETLTESWAALEGVSLEEDGLKLVIP